MLTLVGIEMPNIAKVLKEEITRLARKEVRASLEGTKRVTTQHQRELVHLKGQVSALMRQVLALERALKKADKASEPGVAAKRVRVAPKGLASTRKRLGLSAADLAKMMGVSAQTIYNWERGVTKPRAEQQAKLASLRRTGKREMQAYLSAGHDRSTGSPRQFKR